VALTLKNMTKTYNAIGLMSGTSLDGLDIAYIEFSENHGHWNFEIKCCETIKYDFHWKNTLKNAPSLSAEKLRKLDVEYGHFLGISTAEFLKKNKIRPKLVASHGHTIFHNPAEAYTLQIGDGAAIVSHLNVPVIFDFRSQDVANGGQGAPLVPIGDQFLFGDFDACLNIGGFANISILISDQRLAWDVCPANIVLNELAQSLGFDYDDEGKLASEGSCDERLLRKLRGLEYYSKNPPKSLGREWVEENVLPLIKKYSISYQDLITTFTIHIAEEIARTLSNIKGKVLVSGGGAKNKFLINEIIKRTQAEIIIPNENIIDYKEALIFAFMGVLRSENKINILNSVTGAKKSISAGSIVMP